MRSLGHQWPVYPYNSGPELTQVAEPMKYSAAFVWGDVHVSQAVYDAFGFEVLNTDVANVQPGFVPRQEPKMRTRVFLVAPGELEAIDPSPIAAVGVNPITIHKHGIDAIISVAGDRKSVSDDLINSSAEFYNDSDADAFRREFRLDHNASADEEVNEMVPEIIMESITAALATALPTAYLRRGRVAESRRTWNAMLYAASMMIGSACASTVIDLAEHSVLAGGSALIAGNAIAISRLISIRSQLIGANHAAEVRAQAATELGTRIAADISLLYDRGRFNDTENARLANSRDLDIPDN